MNDNQPGVDELLAPDQEIIDLDDVEGHGLREVAVGLGAAAVLAGGASAAVANSSLGASLPSVHPSGSISVGVSDPIGTADRATDQAIDTARTTRDAGVATAGAAADSATSTATSTSSAALQAAGNAASTAIDYAAQDVQAAKTIAGNVANYASSTATHTVQGAGDRATSTASNTVHTADQSINSTTRTAVGTIREADRKVATVLSVVGSTTQGGVNTITATLRAVNAGAGVDVENAGGWVLVKAGDVLLAQVQMNGGSATVSWTLPVAGDHAVTVNYTGDDLFAPSLGTISR